MEAWAAAGIQPKSISTGAQYVTPDSINYCEKVKMATVEVGMASWKAIRSQRLTKDQDTQTSIEFIFRKEWLHRSIMGTDNATIRWHFLPPLYFLPLINV
jgi:hypothetical protein